MLDCAEEMTCCIRDYLEYVALSSILLPGMIQMAYTATVQYKAVYESTAHFLFLSYYGVIWYKLASSFSTGVGTPNLGGRQGSKG